MIFKFLKFVIVGFSGLFVDFSITFLLKEKLKIHRYISSSTGFIFAASSNYLFNRVWTFESNNPRILSEYGTFLLISLIGLIINNACSFMFLRKELQLLFCQIPCYYGYFRMEFFRKLLLKLHSVTFALAELAVISIIQYTCLGTDSDFIITRRQILEGKLTVN